MRNMKVETHRCIRIPKNWDDKSGDSVYVITECFMDEKGKLWVENVEANTQVNFCPFCGYEALVKMNINDYNTEREGED